MADGPDIRATPVRSHPAGLLRAALVAVGVLAAVVLLTLRIEGGWGPAGGPGTADAPSAGAAGDALEPLRPVLSVDGGYHPAAFDLELVAPVPGEPVLYTLDGSTPDLERNPQATRVYDGPIRIDPGSGLGGQTPPLSTIDTAIDGVVPRWEVLDAPVERIVVVRARTPAGPERTATYLIGSEVAERQLPVVSLLFDPDHLFDPTTGIYVPGDLATRDHAADGDQDSDVPPWELPANYRERGREWERPALDDLDRAIVMEWCEPRTGCEVRVGVGLRIHGNFSRSRPQKSLRLYAREEYGQERFDHDLFAGAGPVGHRRLLLRNSGNDFHGTMFLDAYLQSLLDHLDADTQASRPTVVYFNGEYWGIHNLRERYDAHYLEVVHGADPDRLVLLDEDLEVSAGPADGAEPFLELLEALAAADGLDADLRARVEAELDLDSFLDLVLAHVVVGNWDWPGNNVRLWREPEGPDPVGTGVRDGRWRWLIYDLDHMGERRGRYNVEYDVLSDRLAPSEDPALEGGYPLLFHRLMDDDELRHRFLNRAADLLSTTFSPAHSIVELEAFAARYRPEISLHRQRWWPLEPDDSRWEQDVAGLRRFMEERPQHQLAHLTARFDLPGVVTLTVSGDTRAGDVVVNRVEVAATTPGIGADGKLVRPAFLDVPVALSASARDGQRFVGWEDSDGQLVSTEPALVLTPAEDTELHARFAAE